MEEILFELSLLRKTFPFIKFTIAQPKQDYRILINTINPDKYTFWYKAPGKRWVTYRSHNTQSFSEFLDNLINGLIKFKHY